MSDSQPSWAQQPDEPARWYSRFELYRIMGPNRSLNGAFRLAAQLVGLKSSGASPTWRRAAKRWRWAARAAAWDEVEAARLAGLDAAQRLDRDAQRMEMVDDLLKAVYGALHKAEPENMSKEEARRALPTLRMFFRDLLVAHRTEADHAQEQGAGEIPFSADELREAQGELVRWRALWKNVNEVAGASRGLPLPPPVDEAHWRGLRDVLATLYPDEASVRRVAAQAQLDVARIGFTPRSVDTWHAVLLEAAHSGRLEALMDVAASEYRHHRALRLAVTEVRRQL